MAERDDLSEEQEFLQPFEARALASALKEWGHPVHYKTVERWKNGKSQVKPRDIAAIKQMVAGPDTKTPPPWWEAAAEALVDQLKKEMMPKSTGELADPEMVQRIAAAVADKLGLSRPSDDEVPDAESEVSQDAPNTTAKRQP